MRRANLAGLVVLGALWGAAFLFIRIAAPVLGPVATIEARVVIAGVLLALVAWHRSACRAWHGGATTCSSGRLAPPLPSP